MPQRYMRQYNSAALQKQRRERCQPDERVERCVVRRSALSLPLIAGNDVWGTSCCLSIAAALGMWSEDTAVGRQLSGPLVSTLIALVFSNIGIMSSSSPRTYSAVYSILLPVAVPMLLFTADMRRVVRQTGPVLRCFVLATMSTVVATVVAVVVFPLQGALGVENAWRIASALAARHIGGAVNYVAVNEALGIDASVQSAGLAADNLACAAYFATVFSLARRLPEAEQLEAGRTGAISTDDGENNGESADADQEEEKDEEKEESSAIFIKRSATALAISVCIVKLGRMIVAHFGWTGYLLPVVTAITVVLATLLPRQSASLAAAGEGTAKIILQVFFATVGAEASIASVVRKAPSLFGFCMLQLGCHLALLLSIGKLMKMKGPSLLIASNAAVGGPTTAGGMAASMRWRSLYVPAILCGTLGYSVATFVSILLGQSVLRALISR